MTLPLQLAMPHPVLADISPGGAIYTLILIAWVISRLAGLRKQRRHIPPEDMGDAGPQSPGPGPKPVDAELRELFETITGQKLEPIRPPRPPGPAPVTPPPLPSATRPPPPPRPSRRLHPSLARTAPPTPAPTRRTPPAPPPPPPPAPEIEVRDASGDSAAQAEAIVAAARGTSVAAAAPALVFGHHSAGGHALTIKLPGMRAGLSNANAGQSAHLLTSLRTTPGMRTAMAHRIVLGPPRALDPA